MNILNQSGTLVISGLPELSAANAIVLREKVRDAITNELHAIEIDFGETCFIDSCGLGALVFIYKTARAFRPEIDISLLNPIPPVQQIFELTRMHHLFNIVHRAQSFTPSHIEIAAV